MRQLVIACAATALLTSAAWSQSFNIDLDVKDATGGGLPSDSFGAAAEQAGVWNGIDNSAGPFSLVDLNNQSTGVTVSTPNPPDFTVGSTSNLPGASDDEIALLGDVAYPEGGDLGSVLYEFDGLQDGPYNVYTYAMAPDVDFLVSEVTVNGSDPQQVGGAYGGAFEQGVTHSLHTAEVTDGTLSINIAAFDTGPGTDFATIAGFQLELIPAPSALPLLGMGLLAGRRRRH